jgi:hypothetical protein
VAKKDKFNSKQCPCNDLESKQMEGNPCTSTFGNLIYAQVYTCPDLAFIDEMLGRYLSNPGIVDWQVAKRVMRYL